MSRAIGFTVFIVVVSTIYFLMHYFVFRLLAHHLDFFAKYRKWFKLLFWVSGLSFPISMFLSRTLHFHLFNYYAYIWFGIMAIAFSFFVAAWFLLKIFPGSASKIVFVALVITGLVSVYSLVNGLRFPALKTVTVTVKSLPPGLDGFSIVQLSDLHLEPFKSSGEFAEVVDTVNGLNPDLVVITGDLLEGDRIYRSRSLIDNLKKLRAVHGVWAVTGNHEFFAGIDHFMELAKMTGIKVLRNRMVEVAGGIQLIGLEDAAAKNFGFQGPQLERTVAQCDPQKPIILLYHRPTSFDRAVTLGVDLQLSGHTHSGQIPPLDLILYLYYKYHAGLFEKDGAHIYTSSGTGYWGPPMRFLNRSEITYITLKSAPD